MTAVAITGFAIGSSTLKKVLKNPQPSNIADSSSSLGIREKNAANNKINNTCAPEDSAAITPSKLFDKPKLTISLYKGIIVYPLGTNVTATIQAMTTFLP